MGDKKSKAVAVPQGDARPGPDKDEAKRIVAAAQSVLERRASKPTGPRVTAGPVDGVMTVGPPHEDLAGYSARLSDTFATGDHLLADAFLQQLIDGPGIDRSSPDSIQLSINHALAFIASQKPANEIEAALLIQIWNTQKATLLSQRRFANSEYLPQHDSNGAMAIKLGKLFLQQLDQLNRLRGGGKQEVIVRHEHHYNYLDARGAVIGGPGGHVENLTQPREPARVAGDAATTCLPLLSPHAAGEPMSAAGAEGQEPMRAAWREEPGRSQGQG